MNSINVSLFACAPYATPPFQRSLNAARIFFHFSGVYGYAEPVLADAGPGCDPCGGPMKVIVQSKKGLTFRCIHVSWDEKFKWSIFLSYLKSANAGVPQKREPRLR
jgi:hypothetical protein